MTKKREKGLHDDLSIIGLIILILWVRLYLGDVLEKIVLSDAFIIGLLIIAEILLVGGHIIRKLGEALKK